MPMVLFSNREFERATPQSLGYQWISEHTGKSLTGLAGSFVFYCTLGVQVGAALVAEGGVRLIPVRLLGKCDWQRVVFTLVGL